MLKSLQALKRPATAAEIIAYTKKHRLLRNSKMDASKSRPLDAQPTQAAGIRGGEGGQVDRKNPGASS